MPEDTDTLPQSLDDFDSNFDYKPLDKSFFQRVEERLFRIMNRSGGKKKVPVKVQPPVKKTGPVMVSDPAKIQQQLGEIVYPIPADQEIQNGLLVRKKTLPERVRQSLRFPQIKAAGAIINGVALIVFAAGAYILYANLPMNPNLVVGILLVSVAGNVIISSR